MNHPTELLRLNSKITTTQQLKLLLAEDAPPLEALEVEGEGVDFELLAAVLKKNCQSLKKLTLRADRKKDIYPAAFQPFASALETCTELTFLAIRNFGRQFANTTSEYLNVKRLTKLRTLDISDGHLSWWTGTLLSSALEESNITELHLNSLVDLHWESFCDLLRKNQNVQKIDFRESTISLSAIHSLIDVITAPACTIMEITWTPKDFYSNEIDYLKARYAFALPRDYSDPHSELNTYGLQLDAFKKTGKHDKLKSYQQALSLLEQLQRFLTEKRAGRSKMDLEIEVPDEASLNWNLISAHILLHARAVQHLTIRILNQENGTPYLKDIAAVYFFNALKRCTRLRIFKIEKFQEAFCLDDKYVVGLFEALQTLPIEKLSFNRTYIGPTGVESLKPIFKTGKITEIDLTLAAIVSESSVRTLAKSIASCDSLQKIILGRSPLTIAWWQMLDASVKNHRNPPALEWNITPEKEMDTKMQILCTGIPAYGKKGDERPFVIYEKFCREISDIELKWEQLQAQIQTPESSSTPFPFWSNRTNRNTEEASGMEMSAVPVDARTPLLQSKSKPQQSHHYGSLDKATRKGSKP